MIPALQNAPLPLDAWQAALEAEVTALEAQAAAPDLDLEERAHLAAFLDELGEAWSLCQGVVSALHEATLAADNPDCAIPFTPWGLAGYAIDLLQQDGYLIPAGLPELLRRQADADIIGPDPSILVLRGVA